jgi:hypothetical protein
MEIVSSFERMHEANYRIEIAGMKSFILGFSKVVHVTRSPTVFNVSIVFHQQRNVDYVALS